MQKSELLNLFIYDNVKQQLRDGKFCDITFFMFLNLINLVLISNNSLACS
jgi:hypothetical protein